ncbi:MAG TPA: hypothetical protein VGV40_07065 [Solirubrobacteraceae bacterium]|nr:hypothetical protein [Solirubrobacteraceae bacterium]
MEHRLERVTLETQRHRITGALTLARDGYRSRISDLLNATGRDFISLTDATIEPLDGGQSGERHDFLAVHRDHIVFVAPAE